MELQYSGRASLSSMEEEEVLEREREAPKVKVRSPPSPPLYIGPRERGGAALALPPRKGAAREESILPKAPRRCLPPLGFPPQP